LCHEAEKEKEGHNGRKKVMLFLMSQIKPIKKRDRPPLLQRRLVMEQRKENGI
jgi:hypothetical protein